MNAALADLIVAIAVVSIFFMWILPGIVASRRNHAQQMPIWILTILGGWTIVGWITALVWACSNPPQVNVNMNQTGWHS